MDEIIGSKFTCNVCGGFSVFSPQGDWREAASCTNCASSVRSRQMAYLVSMFTTNAPEILPRVYRHDLTGVGLSDSEFLASQLSKSFNYTNTYYHTKPMLDICNPSEEWIERADFLVSSDVFEHVPAPVSSAFAGTYRVLKAGGVLILTVPFDGRSQTTEHYPNVRQFAVTNVAKEWLLVGKTSSDSFEVHRDLVFHGGPGTTVEMRFFRSEERRVGKEC